MPYIKQKDRKRFDKIFDKFKNCKSFNDFYDKDMIMKDKGELEYCVMKLMKIYMSERPANYCSLHSCVYAVQHCSDEFCRRFLDKREDEAINENGGHRCLKSFYC